MTLAAGGAEDGVGALLPDVELRIGEDAVIHVRRKAPQRPYRILGHSPTPDGWCDTGDLGRIDERGNLHITGRADRRINFGGKNVDPEEVEGALIDCRGVADAAVVGIEAADGERVAAFIRVDHEVAVSDGEIRVELAKALSPLQAAAAFRPRRGDSAHPDRQGPLRRADRDGSRRRGLGEPATTCWSWSAPRRRR